MLLAEVNLEQKDAHLELYIKAPILIDRAKKKWFNRTVVRFNREDIDVYTPEDGRRGISVRHNAAVTDLDNLLDYAGRINAAFFLNDKVIEGAKYEFPNVVLNKKGLNVVLKQIEDGILRVYNELSSR